jgi:hypothetical protein
MINVGSSVGSWLLLSPPLAARASLLGSVCSFPRRAAPPSPRALLLLLLWAAPSVGLLGARSLPSAPFALARRYVDGYGRQSASPLHQPLLASRTRTGLFLSSWLVASWVLVSSPASLLGLPFLPALCALPSAVPARAAAVAVVGPISWFTRRSFLCHRPRSPSCGATLMVPVALPASPLLMIPRAHAASYRSSASFMLCLHF